MVATFPDGDQEQIEFDTNDLTVSDFTMKSHMVYFDSKS